MDDLKLDREPRTKGVADGVHVGEFETGPRDGPGKAPESWQILSNFENSGMAERVADGVHVSEFEIGPWDIRGQLRKVGKYCQILEI